MKRLQLLAAPAINAFGIRSIEAHGIAVPFSDRPDLPQQRGPSGRPPRIHSVQRGMTIIEVLIATAMTLLIMLALAQGFKTLSDGVTTGRARLTHSDQLRGMSSLLRADLKGLTVTTQTVPQTQQSASGYFMIYDGPISDSTAM
ncbi:MAG: type II secretion system protein J, partial [Pirellula sp.]